LEEICSVLSVRTRFSQEHRAEQAVDIVKRTEAMLQNDLLGGVAVSAGSSKDTLVKSVSIVSVDSQLTKIATGCIRQRFEGRRR